MNNIMARWGYLSEEQHHALRRHILDDLDNFKTAAFGACTMNHSLQKIGQQFRGGPEDAREYVKATLMILGAEYAEHWLAPAKEEMNIARVTNLIEALRLAKEARDAFALMNQVLGQSGMTGLSKGTTQNVNDTLDFIRTNLRQELNKRIV